MKLVVTFSLIAFLASCGQTAINFNDEEEQIVKCWQDWPSKVKSGNPELSAFYFADDAIFMGQEIPSMKGKEEIIEFLSPMAKNPDLKVNWGEKPNIISFSNDGSMAYSLDKQEISIPDSNGTVQTKTNQALHVWKKDKYGNWKVEFLLMYPMK